MKYFIIVFALLMFAFSESSAIDSNNLPEGWSGTFIGGQGTVGPHGPIIGYATVISNTDTKTLLCQGKGEKECLISSSSLSSLHNALIAHANSEIVNNSVLSGNHNINMIIDSYSLYGFISWNTDVSTGESSFKTTVNLAP